MIMKSYGVNTFLIFLKIYTIYNINKGFFYKYNIFNLKTYSCCAVYIITQVRVCIYIR